MNLKIRVCVCVHAHARVVHTCIYAQAHSCLFLVTCLQEWAGGPLEIASVWVALAIVRSHSSGQSEGCSCCSLCARMPLGSTRLPHELGALPVFPLVSFSLSQAGQSKDRLRYLAVASCIMRKHSFH